MSFVYLLLSSDNATYVGATVNLERRLRQHIIKKKKAVPYAEWETPPEVHIEINECNTYYKR